MQPLESDLIGGNQMKREVIIETIISACNNHKYVHMSTKQGNELNVIISRWYDNDCIDCEVVFWDVDNCSYDKIKWDDISDVYCPFPKENVLLFAEVSIWEGVAAYVTLKNGKKHHVKTCDYDDTYITMIDLNTKKIVDVKWHEIIDIS